MKRTLSLILSLLTVFSLFSGLSLTAYADAEIGEVRLEIVAPEAGEKMSYYPPKLDLPDETAYKLVAFGMADKNGDSLGRIPDDQVFEAGHIYYVYYALLANKDYEWKPDIENTTVTVDGGTPEGALTLDASDAALGWYGSPVAIGLLSFTVQPADSRVSIVINGKGTVKIDPESPEAGDEVSVLATADDGWVISRVKFADSDGTFNTINYGSPIWTEDTNSFTMPDGDVTVTVDFTEMADTCTVSFDPNGGNGSMPDRVTAKNAYFTLPECGFTKDSVTFSKWEVGGDQYDPGDSIYVSADTTVKAIWKSNKPQKIDNSVDKSTTEVVGRLIMTNTETGEVTETLVYDSTTASEFTQPRNPTVNAMVEEAKAALSDKADTYPEARDVSIDVSDPSITKTVDNRTFTYFDGEPRYLIVDGDYYHNWQITVTFTADYTPVAMDYFSVWISDTEQKPNTGGGVVVSYALPDGTEPEGNTAYYASSANLSVPVGSHVTLTAEPYAYLGYRFVGWYQANINKASPDDPHYLADKPISSKKTYTFTGNPVGEGEAPYICAVFEDTGIIRQGDQIQVWITDGGKAAVEYHPSEPNVYEFEATDGTEFVPVGAVVQYYKGDEITVHQQADEGYVFKGWYHVWIEWGPGSEHPKYEGEVISTEPTFTYKPGETIVEGDTEPLRYVCAVFEEKSDDFTVTTRVIGSGTATLEPENPKPGDRVKVKMKADAGWVLSDFYVGDSTGQISAGIYGESGMTEDSISFTMREDNVEVVVGFKKPAVAIILGDVDGDGEVTIIDATYIQRVLADLPVAVYIAEAADTDGDGEVAIIDATYIQRHIAGLSAPEGIGKPI